MGSLLARPAPQAFHPGMKSVVSRRDFLRQASATLSFPALGGFNLLRAGGSPASGIRIGIIGCNNRGMDHIASFLAVPNVEIACICDVDSRAVAKGIAAVAKKQTRAPKGVQDLRRVLDDPDVDAISIAMPDHWHAPATILACAAGKHVYVEKPGSHNAHESGLMIAAARKHKRVVQMGNQRRSWPWVTEAMAALHAGEIGKVFLARGWYANHRPTIGRGKPAPVPDWLNYDLWQGPAPERAFCDNVIHYNWHWFWHWGTGEIGNNGVHGLDLSRWGLGVDYPSRVSSGGGIYYFDDDQETPDSQVVTFEFGDKMIVWEGRNWHPRGFEGSGFGACFYGDQGTLLIDGGGYKVYDRKDKLITTQGGSGGDNGHIANFLDAVRGTAKPHAEIETGYQSTLLCLLGSIAHRTGHTLHCDPKNGQILDDQQATALWSREYEPGWEPKV